MIIVFDGKIAMPRMNPVFIDDRDVIGTYKPGLLFGHHVYASMSGYAYIKEHYVPTTMFALASDYLCMGVMANTDGAFIINYDQKESSWVHVPISDDIRALLMADDGCTDSVVISELSSINKAITYMATKHLLPLNHFKIIDFSSKSKEKETKPSGK